MQQQQHRLTVAAVLDAQPLTHQRDSAARGERTGKRFDATMGVRRTSARLGRGERRPRSPQPSRGMTRSANSRIEVITRSCGTWPPLFIHTESVE